MLFYGVNLACGSILGGLWYVGITLIEIIRYVSFFGVCLFWGVYVFLYRYHFFLGWGVNVRYFGTFFG